MALIRSSSPHLSRMNTTGSVMLQVLLATIPGLIALTVFFGWGTLTNVIFASILAVAFEAAIVTLRKRPVIFYLKDFSAVVTAVLLALAIPPFAPWWITAVGVFVAIVIAKHLYGGLGQNPFNPAMIAYALLLVSFPVQMTQWTIPSVMAGADGAWNLASLGETFSFIFGTPTAALVDGYTGATPLDALKHRAGLTTEEAWRQVPVLLEGMGAWRAVNFAFLAGGVFLIYKKVITWHIPVAFLGTIFVFSGLLFSVNPDNFGDPFFHIMAGGTMLGAFFIATDPVTASTSNKGKVYYAIGIGVLLVIIRTWGNYPDAVAFAVLLMNLCAPFIDQYTQPRTYGHAKPNRGTKGDS